MAASLVGRPSPDVGPTVSVGESVGAAIGIAGAGDREGSVGVGEVTMTGNELNDRGGNVAAGGTVGFRVGTNGAGVTAVGGFVGAGVDVGALVGANVGSAHSPPKAVHPVPLSTPSQALPVPPPLAHAELSTAVTCVDAEYTAAPSSALLPPKELPVIVTSAESQA